MGEAKDADRRGRRLRRDGLTAIKRARFLEVLGETSNVQRAAQAAMAGVGSFYRLRERDAAFAAAWQAALERGYDAIESELLSAARGSGTGGGTGGGGFDPALGMAMLTRRDKRAQGDPGYGRKTSVKHVPIAEVEKEILRRLDALAKRLAKS